MAQCPGNGKVRVGGCSKKVQKKRVKQVEKIVAENKNGSEVEIEEIPVV